MTKNQIERFAVGYPYPTDWIEIILKHFDFDTNKAKQILLSESRTYEIVQCEEKKNLNTTTLEDGITKCCGYDFGLDGFGIVKVKFCPICGKKIINVN